MVSSGAIALGVRALGLARRPAELPALQAAAAAGQSRLMQHWEHAFAAHGMVIGQVLLTHDDLGDRRRFLSARHPARAARSRRRADHQRERHGRDRGDQVRRQRPARRAGVQPGLGRRADHPHRRRGRARRRRPADPDRPRHRPRGGAGRDGATARRRRLGRHGEQGRLGADRDADRGPGRGRSRPPPDGADRGPRRRRHRHPVRARRATCCPARKHWIAYGARPAGRSSIDDGAVRAVTQAGKSLLPAGSPPSTATSAPGRRSRVIAADGRELARGLVAYDAEELRKIRGLQSADFEARLGYKGSGEAIHRDDLVIL